ncbi:MAG: peptidase M22 [Ruminococcaceae bacterium]|nr:peptidase M22 [Oscillospiraceae bacterium]
MKKYYVGFDTSNYTTSVAVADSEGRIVANLKRPLPVKSGECGLRQSDALFAHIKNLPSITDELSEVIKGESVAAVGVSSKPRDAEGSYMPCFLAGVAAAHSFAAAVGARVSYHSHQNGHIMAAAYSSGRAEYLLGGRFMALHVSGGTTEALLVTPRGASFEVELVGGTRDLNAGQIIDRVGVSLGLSFPCGKALEELALSYSGGHRKTRITVRDGFCNLSGLENMAKGLYEKNGDSAEVAAFVFDFIRDTLIEICRQTAEKYGRVPVLFGGGVMSNRYMRKEISSELEAYFSEPQFSADNAAGIALLCRRESLFSSEV